MKANEGSFGCSGEKQYQHTPAAILELKHKPDDVEKVVSIAAGDNHILALTTHGNIYSWGTGEQGQLGRKIIVRHKISSTVPAKVILGKRTSGTKKPGKTVRIGAGAFTSFAVDEDGVLWAWGLNKNGQTGTGSKEDEVGVPTKVIGLNKEELGGDAVVVAMEGGAQHSVFLASDGRVYACGRAEAGQIGVPKDHEALVSRGKDGDHVREPVRVEFDKDEGEDPVVAISCGVHNNAAITRGGALYGWGQGMQGEHGVKREVVVWTPTMVVRREGGDWKGLAVACGGQHTFGLFQKKE
jgi:regulator of chromosome condensation